MFYHCKYIIRNAFISIQKKCLQFLTRTDFLKKAFQITKFGIYNAMRIYMKVCSGEYAYSNNKTTRKNSTTNLHLTTKTTCELL